MSSHIRKPLAIPIRTKTLIKEIKDTTLHGKKINLHGKK
jgi:hypothetical protein